MPKNSEGDFKKEDNFYDFYLKISLELEPMNFTIFRLLTMQLLHSKLGKVWLSSSGEKKIAINSHDNGLPHIAKCHLSKSVALKKVHILFFHLVYTIIQF